MRSVPDDPLEPLIRFERAQDVRFERVEPYWWGAVVSDRRFPRVQEANYARVEARQPVALEEVEDALLPAMRRSGAERSHVLVFHAQDQGDLLAAASTRGERLAWDLVMRHAGPSPSAPANVDEVPFAAIEDTHRESLGAFGIADDAVRMELNALEHDVFLPAGRRWFAVRERGVAVTLAGLLVLEGVGYLDHVVTMPEARGRGFASAATLAALAAASDAGASETFLLADPEGRAVVMYERLGFRSLPQIASWISPMLPG
jgi:ribosomal protein S18 acetylase RimI-like enzyme